jgi:3-oxoacyl-[acyl-carrier-protein] synthase II
VKIAISGLGWITATGKGCGKDHRSFAMTTDRLSPIDRKDVFDQPYKNFGRMDEYSRVGLAAVAFALRDAGLEQFDTRRDIGLVAQTEYGCLWTDIDYYYSALPQGGTMASPNLFAYTLPNCFMGEAAIRFGLTGESYIINEPSGSGLAAVALALEEIAAGTSQTMICGRCDLGRPPLLATADEIAAGALFFVMQHAMPEPPGGYGTLERTENGQLFFNQQEITDLTVLARECLRIRHQSP